MQTMTTGLDRWTSDELLTEVIKRSAASRPALRLLETKILNARLAAIDEKTAADRDDAQPLP